MWFFLLRSWNLFHISQNACLKISTLQLFWEEKILRTTFKWDRRDDCHLQPWASANDRKNEIREASIWDNCLHWIWEHAWTSPLGSPDLANVRGKHLGTKISARRLFHVNYVCGQKGACLCSVQPWMQTVNAMETAAKYTDTKSLIFPDGLH